MARRPVNSVAATRLINIIQMFEGASVETIVLISVVVELLEFTRKIPQSRPSCRHVYSKVVQSHIDNFLLLVFWLRYSRQAQQRLSFSLSSSMRSFSSRTTSLSTIKSLVLRQQNPEFNRFHFLADFQSQHLCLVVWWSGGVTEMKCGSRGRWWWSAMGCWPCWTINRACEQVTVVIFVYLSTLVRSAEQKTYLFCSFGFGPILQVFQQFNGIHERWLNRL
jgi:hypothetical protein